MAWLVVYTENANKEEDSLGPGYTLSHSKVTREGTSCSVPGASAQFRLPGTVPWKLPNV
jgi:hypothetical protein